MSALYASASLATVSSGREEPDPPREKEDEAGEVDDEAEEMADDDDDNPDGDGSGRMTGDVFDALPVRGRAGDPPGPGLGDDRGDRGRPSSPTLDAGPAGGAVEDADEVAEEPAVVRGPASAAPRNASARSSGSVDRTSAA